MTPKEFLDKAAAYYGEYRAAVAAAIADYLEDKPQAFIAGLWQAIISKFEGKYPPQLATLQNYAGEAWSRSRKVEGMEKPTHWEARLVPEWGQIGIMLTNIRALFNQLTSDEIVKLGKFIKGQFPPEAVYFVRVDQDGEIYEESEEKPNAPVDGLTVNTNLSEQALRLLEELKERWITLKGKSA